MAFDSAVSVRRETGGVLSSTEGQKNDNRTVEYEIFHHLESRCPRIERHISCLSRDRAVEGIWHERLLQLIDRRPTIDNPFSGPVPALRADTVVNLRIHFHFADQNSIHFNDPEMDERSYGLDSIE